MLMDIAKLAGRRYPRALTAYRWIRGILRNRFRTPKTVFTRIYETRAWGEYESVSGRGSTHEATERIRAALPALLAQFNVRTILDAPCGDFHWMRKVDLGAVDYIGVDVVPGLVERLQRDPGASRHRFLLADITRDELPSADLVLCRDCLIHLPFARCFAALSNFHRSGIKYLLTTHCPNVQSQTDIETGSFRPLNLRLSPFDFPQPLATIIDAPDGAVPDDGRCLALWRIEDLPRLRG
jgi:hypothetical protein